MKNNSKPQMRPSRVLAKLRAGEIVSCYKLNLDSARAAEIVALAGFDCLWTCMEHTPNDYELIERQIWAAKCYDVDVVVRVPRGSYSDYIRPLELDAAGIMVPHIMSAEDARNVVRMTRFNPIGRRPVDGGNADGQYCNIDFCDYLKQANEQRFVIVQIEDPEPLAELDAIAQIKGIDMLFFGPGDFSHSIGAPGEWNHPRVVDTRRRVAEVARKHGKFAGTLGNTDNLKDLIALGYQFINLGADVLAIAANCRTIVQSFSDQKMLKKKN
ncbi:MAG: aldolase/citrate lyase family protein [Kiritimatiellia bacterium]|nr:aldolase/citrate lyase family protein [Kiritimatiellia bacterium]